MCKRCEAKTFCDFSREPWKKNKTDQKYRRNGTNAISSVARYRSREGLSQSELDELTAAYKQETEISDAFPLSWLQDFGDWFDNCQLVCSSVINCQWLFYKACQLVPLRWGAMNTKIAIQSDAVMHTKPRPLLFGRKGAWHRVNVEHVWTPMII